MTEGALIAGARRTPVSPRGGEFARLELFELGSAPALAALSDAGLTPAAVDEVIMGNCLGPGGNPARSIALAAGCPELVPGLTIDRQCCSGLDAILLAKALIAGGRAEVILAGGVECYSKHRRLDREAVDKDSPEQAPFTPWPDRDPQMADAAARLAVELNMPRERQDSWAVDSHRKAEDLRIRESGEFALPSGSDLKFDSFARRLTLETCRRAKPISGSVTIANSAVAADGGAVCVVVSESVAKGLGIRGLRIAGGATVGGDPELPGLAPIAAIGSVLEKAGRNSADLSVAEIMEAYSVQAIACIEGAGIDPEIVNLGGGALARGHPIAASGAILAVRLFHEMKFRRAACGIAAIASAGGIGTALLLDRQ